MSRRALVLDGLWYSLCPSFTTLSLSRSTPIPKPTGRNPRLYPLPSISSPSSGSRRCYNTSGGDSYKVPYNATYHNDRSEAREPRENEYRDAHLSPDPTYRPPTRRKGPLYTRTHKVQDDLLGKTNEGLESRLQYAMDNKPNIRHITQILRLLIRDRHVQPNARHYKALILANTDNERGSPQLVRGLLEEMENNGITADSGTLHGALQVGYLVEPSYMCKAKLTMQFLIQVLAVHPDYLLRQEILNKLRDRWLTLSPAGWHFVVAGLLRENQIELALEHVALMERKDISVENWLHSIIVYTLCDHRELDEVYNVMRARVDQGHNMTHRLWMHVLTEAGKQGHYPMAHYAWRRMVELGYMHPLVEVCDDVLKMAANAGDTDMASSVFRYLRESGIPLERTQYERLVETHVAAGDLPAAFEALCTMHEAQIPLADSSTERILAHMVQSKVDRREAWQILKRLKNAKRAIPIDSVRVIADLCEHDARDDPSVVDDGVGFYKELYTLCPEGADVRVYNALIRMCRTARNRESGMFLVKEMASLGVVPNGVTFESIILMCLDAGNFRSGFMYFQDLMKRDARLSPETQVEIREICAGSVDEFAMRLQYHPFIRDDVRKLDEELQQKQKEKEANEKAGRHPVPPAVRRLNMSDEQRREYNKERRKKKRRRLAIERNMREEGWDEWEAGGTGNGSTKSE
jgi:pentatricopeptide repeat protein